MGETGKAETQPMDRRFVRVITPSPLRLPSYILEVGYPSSRTKQPPD